MLNSRRISSRIQGYFFKPALAFLLFIAFFSGVGPSRADLQPEYTLKAGFIYNFLRLVQFQANPDLIQICVSDGDVVARAFAPLESRSLGSTKLQLKSISELAELSPCKVVFVSRFSEYSLKDLLSKVDGRGVLTIGETSSFTKEGGVIRFFTEENKIRFEVNLTAAEKQSIQLSSQLLKLARVVR